MTMHLDGSISYIHPDPSLTYATNIQIGPGAYNAEHSHTATQPPP